MSQVNLGSNPSAAVAGTSTPTDITLIAQSAAQRSPGATLKAQQRLRTLPDGQGDVGLRDSNGDTVATTLKARQVLRDGQWRNEGFVAERMSAYSATAPHRNAQPESNGYGYFRGEHGKMRLITASDGRVITDLPQARARASEMMRHGGLSMTTDAQAQTANDAMMRKPSTSMVTNTQVTQWKPVIPLPKPIEQMSPTDRAKYMVKEAIRVAPASVKKELQGLLTPQNLALMTGFASAQYVPGLNVVVDVAATMMLGKEATAAGVKIFSAIQSALTTQQPYELVKAGDQLAEAFSHLGVGAGTMLIGGVAAKGAGQPRTNGAPAQGVSLPPASTPRGANNIVPFARRSSSPASGRSGGSGERRRSGRSDAGGVATVGAPVRAGAAAARAPSVGAGAMPASGKQGSRASRTPVPAVLPLPTVRAGKLPVPAVPPLPTAQAPPQAMPPPPVLTDEPKKRRGAGDEEPGKVDPGATRTPAEEKKFQAWLTRQGDVRRQQQLNEYREGRATREEALHGRKGADRQSMSAALDQIDRMRVAGGQASRSASGRNHTTAEVKDIWRDVDRAGGVLALPEATLRQVRGITEQALKDTKLTAAERSDFTTRLADARKAQTQYHKAREATKSNPPVDTSAWNLPMGEVVFGKLPDPGKGFAGLIQPAGSQRRGSLTAPVTFNDPLTGTVVKSDRSGRLTSRDPNAPTNITASQPGRASLDVPSLQSLERIGFQRNGPRITITVGDYSVIADVWGQKDPRQIIDLRDLPKDEIHSSQDLVDRVAQALAARAPHGAGWSVSAAGPAATAGASQLGLNAGNYIGIGDLQAAISQAAVLYNPSAAPGSRYRLNTRVDANGDAVLVRPLEITVGKRAAVSPTSVPGMPPIGMSLSFSRVSEIKVSLEGKVNPSLLASLNAGLNNPLAKQIWHDGGSTGYRQVRQINFALPGTVAREGSYRMPPSWFTLQGKLVPADKRDDPSQWTTFTSGVGMVGLPNVFGLGAKMGFKTTRVEAPATDYRRAIRDAYDQPAQGGILARPQSVKPFIFTATDSGGSLAEVLPDNPAEMRRAGEWVQPDVMGTLAMSGASAWPSVPMSGAVLNAINGHRVTATDLPLIVKFLRSLNPGGAARSNVDQAIYDVVQGLTVGQPMSRAGQQSIRRAIREYASEAP